MPESSSQISFRERIVGLWRAVFIQRIERMKMTEHTFTILVSILIGFLAGFGAIGVRFLIKIVEEISFGSGMNILEKAALLPWYEKIIIPMIGGIIVGPLIYYFAKEAKGHGVPEVMEAVVLRDGVIRPRVALIKAIASSISIGTGGSVGREGPVVQIGSSIGSTIGQILMVSGRRLRTFVACGAAAGIAAAFNAPIAGALFSVEIILGDFGLTYFSPIVISSVVATVISRHFMGDFAAFDVPTYRLVDPRELIFYFGLGIFCGFVALVFIKVLYFLESYFENLKLHETIKPAIGGIVIGIMALWIPHIFGVGYESINLALNSNMAWSFLLLLTFAKVLATSITLGSGGSGGIFAPSLFIGAMAGGFFGNIVNILAPNITASPGAYALVGMGAVVSGATHAPITAILIIFELTNDYKIILPLMISCIISTIFTSKLHKESIYTLKLALRGINIFKGKEVNVLRKLSVKDVMEDAEVIPEDLSFNDLIDRITASKNTTFYVVDKGGRFLGTIHLKDISGILKDIETLKDILIAKDLVSGSNLFLYPDDNLDHAMHIFGNSNVEEIPVLDPSGERKLLGKVRENDIVEAYNKEIFKIDTLTELSEGIGNIDKRGIESFTDEFGLAEISAPLTFVGKDLKELSLRQRFGVQVLLVKKQMPESKESRYIDVVPKPDTLIEENDILVLAGPQKSLLQLRNL
ncbi:MAG: CBS domain-containing protein [Candidatus Schekmanbacteria bacterium]|nr:MAG: CBS domain-containing protein [Candidatus Schekmanbacteria bacterium]